MPLLNLNHESLQGGLKSGTIKVNNTFLSHRIIEGDKLLF
jgi:hypothetical protein